MRFLLPSALLSLVMLTGCSSRNCDECCDAGYGCTSGHIHQHGGYADPGPPVEALDGPAAAPAPAPDDLPMGEPMGDEPMGEKPMSAAAAPPPPGEVDLPEPDSEN